MSIYPTIYKLENTLNGKVYIGKTIQRPNTRRRQHINDAAKGANTPLHAAIRKYGIDNFDFQVIFVVFKPEELGEFEKQFIKQYDCCVLDGKDKGYNLSRGGEGIDPEVMSLSNRKQVELGIHPFQGERGSKHSKKIHEDRRAAGIQHHHEGEAGSIHFSEIQAALIERGEHYFQTADAAKHVRERVSRGVHHFQGEIGSKFASQRNKERLQAGTHNLSVTHECPHCGKTGKGAIMFRHHFDNCKIRRTQ
jgi:group I intron endonuclease